MDKPNANYKELDLIISTKNSKEDNIIPDGNSIEYNTFDNL